MAAGRAEVPHSELEELGWHVSTVEAGGRMGLEARLLTGRF